ADVGFTLRIVVVASNTYGDATAESDPTEPIAAGPPHVKGRTIIGTNGNDYEAGGAHDDTIIGRGGNDTLLGGAGRDRVVADSADRTTNCEVVAPPPGSAPAPSRRR